eukprot:COSAG06_NODE_5234_length_3621_cov_4.128904_3_plen_63_part_00
MQGALPAAQRLQLVGELVPAGDQWFNDPEKMEAARREAARLAVQRQQQTHAGPSTFINKPSI